jgi:heme/copper-type cytochrome/quinol oxidase subunit 1
VAGQNKTAMLAWLGAGLVAVAGVIMLGIGLFTPMGAASFGWFAYQPLANATFVPGGSAVVLSRITAVGWIIFTIGLVTLAFLAGRVAGRRSPP